MSPFANALKIGTTACVLSLLEQRQLPRNLVLNDAVRSTRDISRDPTRKWIVDLENGKTIGALDVQWQFHELAAKHLRNRDPETDWLLESWSFVLESLEQNQAALIGGVDWITKKWLLDTFVESENLEWNDPWLQAIDLEYHNLNRDEGLYYELLRQGSMRRVVTEEEVKAAIFTPPDTTRAYFRGRSVARFNDAIESIQWDEMVFTNGAQPCRIRFPEASADARLEALNAVIRDAADYKKLLESISAL